MKRTAILCGLIVSALLRWSSRSLTQTGPGGIGNSSSNLLWLDGGNGTYQSGNQQAHSNNDSISEWRDVSGNGHHFSASGKKPLLKTGSGGINGNNAIFFSSTGEALVDQDGESYINNLSAFSLYFVIQSDSVNSDRGLFDTENPDGKDDIITLRYNAQGDNGSGNQVVKGGILSDTSINQIESSSNQQTTSPQLMGLDWESGSSLNLYFNGELNSPSSASGTPTASLSGASKAVLGKGSMDGSSKSWAGKIGEVIIYNQKLNDVEKTILDNFLSSKYGISIPDTQDFYAGDLPGNGDYDYGVIGIGKTGQTRHAESRMDGLVLKRKTGFQNRDFLFTGHSGIANGLDTTDTGGVQGLEGRWKRIWYFDITDANTAMQIDMIFDKSEGGLSGSAGNATNYVLLYRSGQSGNWQSISTASSASSDSIIFNNVVVATYQDGYYTLGSTNLQASPLPVKLVRFDVNTQGMYVNLSWITATEQNSDHFQLQKSFDGKHFKTFKTIKAAGESFQTKNYQATDPSPFYPVTYYRLNQVDITGETSLSSVKLVQLDKNKSFEITPFPNPANSEVTINVITDQQRDLRFILFNPSGKRIAEKTETVQPGRDQVIINLENYPSGWYWLQVYSGKHKFSKKIYLNR